MPHSHGTLPTAAGKSSFDLVDTEAVFAALALRPGETLLDLGCGVGNYALAAARRHPEAAVVAVDLWADGVAELSRRAEAAGLRNVTAHVADAGRLPLVDAGVDAVLMATVLHDLAADGRGRAALAEAARVLRPGGRLAVVEFRTVEGPPGPPLALRLGPDEVASRAAVHGFRRRAVTDAGPWTYLALFRLGQG
ncbi:methyltransferase domain-containing protein [Dissulfurirhabdus thermomarina]|uniref:Methyltransferase domain-containing protein n=1 Tax=Dissulfurirhabdus thermomarina TaxID=1765737 RepID=A0A6N9TXF8_DISTH|nr:methyltransferase domain-containing protein [Dissulfurirhabdus thermomarina]NDY43156.1 methyltransferase domain-containing protein [Dissulfurirhabdus thermomarina]NMX23936.1 methyltransferase domain-containing protein [Dissulfurirhabdus thermomarina]